MSAELPQSGDGASPRLHEVSESRFSRGRLWLGWTGTGLTVALVGLWLLAITGTADTATVARGVSVPAVAFAAILAGRALVMQARRRPELVVLLVLGVVLGFAGLGHEVGEGYYADEGHYLHHAREVDDGKLFTPSFVYPHLLYYLDAFALWLADLWPGVTAWTADAFYGVRDPEAVSWLVLRWAQGALGVSALVPVFLLAAGLAGRRAATLAGALQILSVHYHLGFQVNISDVPSASLAAWCLLYVGRLARRESLGDYLRAGVCSGLAAAAKYPAGTVAVAIVGVWVLHRLRTVARPKRPTDRRPPPRTRWLGLPLAGLVSLSTFLALNPSWLVFTEAALHGPRGVFFGVRQYAEGGWIGVTRSSNTLYYLDNLAGNFGLAALVLAAIGLLGLPRRIRRGLLWLLPFPVTFFLLVCAMNMVVLRNLFPLLPAAAVFLGVGLSGAARLVRRRFPRRWRTVAGIGAMVVLAQPAAATVRQAVSLARGSTREAMADWVREHVPRGAGILKESYTSRFAPTELLVLERRFAFRIDEPRFNDPRFDFLLLAGHAYARFFRPENQSEYQAAWYQRIFDTKPLVHQIEPGPFRLGPELRLYRLEPDDPPRDRRRFRPDDAFLTHPSMAGEDQVRFTPDGTAAIFRDSFVPGDYRLRLLGQLSGDGTVVVRDLANRRLAEAPAKPDEAIAVVLPAGPVFIEVVLPKGSRLDGMTVTPAAP